MLACVVLCMSQVLYGSPGSVTTKCFRLVGLSTPPVLTLCLKDPQMWDNTIYPEYLMTVGVILWNNLPGCWPLKDKKLSVNN